MFHLYRIDSASHSLVQDVELKDHLSLWGRDGAVARSAKAKFPEDGPWKVSEEDLLLELRPRIDRSSTHGSALAIIDDLVPNGPEIIMGRILRMSGVLRQGYNPLLITMQQALSLEATQINGRPAVDIKRRIPAPEGAAPLIRTFNYLRRGWSPPRSISGAFLWPEVWDQLTQD